MVFIVGPTAVGKTGIAADVAARTGAEIINADAFQVYRGLDLLTGKPSAAVLQKAPHHLLGEIALTHRFDAAQFLKLARERVEAIEARGKRVIVAGGTGLYVRALTHGLAALPPADAGVRGALEQLSLAELQVRLAGRDPVSAASIDLQNKRRLVRALEVIELTGKPFSSFREEWARGGASDAAGFLLVRDRVDLHQRIEQRVQQMFDDGLLAEVLAVSEIGPTAAQALGWREALACARGELPRAEAIAQIQQATRRYAKRQLTWFRRDSMFEALNLTTLSSETVTQATAHTVLSQPAPPHV